MKTPDELNDQFRAQVESELPTPIGGFECEESKQAHRDAHEQRFLELCARHREHDLDVCDQSHATLSPVQAGGSRRRISAQQQHLAGE